MDYSLMAGRADPFGMNETEEERQRRLAAEAAQAQAAPQPAAAQPVDPAQIFQRMLQVESGNRQFTPQGQVVTSPRGAIGVAQIMPETAMQPGYGVKNIFDLAAERGMAVPTRDRPTAIRLLANEQLNRQFGENYFNAMNRQFGTQGAVAAYNAGPGRVQRGGTLPAETQNYVRQVMPQQPLPRAVPGPGVQVATGQGVVGGEPAPAAAPAAAPTLDFINQYQTIQDDPRQLLSFGFREDTPEWLRNRAKSRAGELLRQQDEEARARAMIPTMSESELARALKEKTTGGSYFKAILFGILGMEQSQLAEAAKLGIGKEQAVMLPDNTAAIVKIAANGTPIEGYNAQTGAKLTPEQLVTVQAGAAPRKAADMPSVHGVPVQRMNEQGQVVTGLMMYDPQSRESYVQVGKNRVDTTGWTTMAQTPTNVFSAAAAGAAGKGAGEGFTPGQLPAFPGQQGQQQAASQAQQAAQAMQQGARTPATVTPQAPQVPPVGTIAQQRQALEMQGVQQQTFIKQIAEDIQPKADAGSQIKRIRREQLDGPDGLIDNAELAGLLSGRGGTAGEVGNIFRDVITAKIDNQTDLNARIAALSLNDRQKSVLYRQLALNMQVAPFTLKQNAGAGAVSDAEQKANREANVDITRMPFYASLSLLTADQFQKDLAIAKNDFRISRPDIKTSDQLNAAWSQEKRKAEQAYNAIYAERARYLALHDPRGENINAQRAAFKLYPVPDWTGTNWDYKTPYARRAAMDAVIGR